MIKMLALEFANFAKMLADLISLPTFAKMLADLISLPTLPKCWPILFFKDPKFSKKKECDVIKMLDLEFAKFAKMLADLIFRRSHNISTILDL